MTTLRMTHTGRRLPDDIKVVAFDADDTLWDCQSHFDNVEREMAEMLAPWCTIQQAHDELVATEMQNISLSGYGCKAFILSVIETAVRVSRGEIASLQIGKLIQSGYRLLQMPATPLKGVEETLQVLGRHRKVVFTKGDLKDQQQKLERSGLGQYFEHVEITSNKSEQEFRQLCQRLSIKAEELVMVGNSFKSDIAPALNIGAWAVHVPFHVNWQLEDSQEFDHEKLIKISRFEELKDFL